MKNILNGKNCIITGASSGIGKELSIHLAKYEPNLIIVCRNAKKGETVKSEIKEKTGNCNIDLLLIDLSSQNSIKNGVVLLKEKYKKIDILINNAGVILFDKVLTEDGIEKTFATNYLGTFLLTTLLLDLLKKQSTSRIINIVSEGTIHNEINIKNLENPKKYNAVKAYSESKQAEIIFTYELAKRLQNTNITVNCFYPGLVKTNLGKVEKGFRKLTYSIISSLLKSKFIPIEESIKLGLFLAISPKVKDITGKYFKREGGKVIQISEYNEELAKELWNLSITLTGKIDSLI